MLSSENFSGDEFRKLSLHLPDMIFQFTRRPDGSYIVPIASKGIVNIFGCNPEDVKDSFDPITKVIHPEDALRVFEQIEESAKKISEFHCEFRVCIPNKPIQWILSRSTPELLQDGSVSWYGFNANITNQKKTRNKLEEIIQKQAAILRAIPYLVFEIGIDKIIYDYHSEVSELLAAPPDFFVGKAYDEIMPKEVAEVVTLAIQETIEKGASTGLEYVLNLPSGSFWFELTVTNINLPALEERRFMVLARDITERKIENDKLRQLSHAVEQSNTSIVIADLDGNLEYVNNYFLKLTGYTREEVIGKNPRILNSGYTKKEDYKKMWDTIKSGGTWQGVFLNKKKNGSMFWEEINISPVKNDQGVIINFLAIKTDITKQKKTDEKFRKIAWDQSHQVRGPLTDILGILNILKMNISEEERSSLMENLENASKQLDQVIHKVIDETKKPV